MGIVTSKEMFQKAYEGHYAIGAFNVNNMEIVQAVTEAAKEMNSPVILQVSSSARKYAGNNYLMKMIEAAILDTNLPIVVHLDHGADFEICKDCIDSGFSSVMIDGSKYPFEENIELTKRVVDYAHERGVVVEAELGKLAGIEDDVNVSDKDSSYTNPDQAVEFVQRTGCDSLAVAIGTSHGAYKFKGDPQLRFDILEQITNALPNYPLVLHGASTVVPELVNKCNHFGGDIPGAKGVPEDMLRKAATFGICKINVDTDLRLALTAAIREFFVENPSEFDPRKYMGAGRDLVKEIVKNKIVTALGSDNKI